VLLEVDDAWARVIRELDEIFPHRLVHPRTDNFGIAILSRHSLEDARTVEFGGVDVPSIVARVIRDAGSLTVVATHPVPPLGAANARDRDAALRALADYVAGAPSPCIVAGDFNATPWCAAFRDLVTRSGLRDTALGRGVQPTWNALSWVPRIPIDHVLAPPGTVVLRRAVGPGVGSDHFPVEAEIVLP
jgi:endonuclease/exonuclease/phosphatase (EEP) superfamily protein YafD